VEKNENIMALFCNKTRIFLKCNGVEPMQKWDIEITKIAVVIYEMKKPFKTAVVNKK
jgi:hypothetical protein